MKILRRLATALLCLAAGLAAAPSHAGVDDLRQRHAQLQGQLKKNGFGHALYVVSEEQQDRLTGDVYALLDHPFDKVNAAMREPARWCDILILPFNTKYCHAVDAEGGPALLVRIGRKYDQPVEQAFRIAFAWRSVAAQPDYFETRLFAKEGPVGTHDYRIDVAAMPVDGNRTFLRLTYSYGVGMAGRMAMGAYLSTAGADKVGFTVVGREPDGQPQYIKGVRGAIERTAMRYYLAIDSYLDAQAAPPAQRAEKRIQSWFTATEHYPRQLREMDRQTYVAMKRVEVERQKQPLEGLASR
jgi:hypothetical protein